MFVLLLAATALGGVGVESWEAGSADYPTFTPGEVSTWSTSPGLPTEALFGGGWVASWSEGTGLLRFSGLEDGSLAVAAETGAASVDLIAAPAGVVVGWGWAVAFEAEVEVEPTLHVLEMTGTLTGAQMITWKPTTGWVDGATGPATPEVPPIGAPWSLAVMDGTQGLTLAADRVKWEVSSTGLDLLQIDASGTGLEYGAEVAITLSWLE